MGLSLRNITKGIGDFIGGVTSVPYNVGASVNEAARLGIANLTRNRVAANNARFNLGQRTSGVTMPFTEAQHTASDVGKYGAAYITRNRRAQDNASSALNQHAQNAFIVSPFAKLGANLGTSLASDYVQEQARQGLITPEQASAILNEQYAPQGINLSNSPWEVRRKIAGLGAEAALNLATVSNLEGVARAKMPLTGNILERTAARARPGIKTGATVLAPSYTAAQTLQSDKINPAEIAKNLVANEGAMVSLPIVTAGGTELVKVGGKGAKVVARAAPQANDVIVGQAAKLDPQWRKLDSRVSDATARASRAPTAAERNSAKIEARELIRLRNARRQEIVDNINSKGMGMSMKAVKDEPRPQVTAAKPTTVEPKKVGLATEVKRGLTDKDQVILAELRNIEKQTGQKGLVDKFMYNSNMQRGSNATANRILQDSPNIKAAIGGLSKENYQAFSDYANARTELSTAGRGVNTSRPVSELSAIVKQGDVAFGKRFEALNAHYKELATEAQKAGLITKETLAHYGKNNDYVRLQKDMGDLVQNGSGRGNGYSLGSTILNQGRKGSKRANLNAGEVAAEYTQQIQKEIARNRTATQLADTLEKYGQAKQLINADDVKARRAAFGKLKELKPVRDALAQEAKSTTKQLRALVNRNKELGPSILKKIQASGDEVRKNAITLANDGKRAVNRPDSKRLSRAVSEADVNEAFQRYLDGDPRLVRNMYEFIGNKAESTRVQNKLDGLKAQFESVKKERADIWLDAKSHADKTISGKNTMSVMRDGVREVYEVSPDIKQAVDNINPYHMNVVMQILAAPGRTLRAGVTGLNPVFIARNLLKDQVGSAINSDSIMRTHNPSSFFRGLFNATSDSVGLNNNPLYKDFLKHYGDQTSFDLTRNAKEASQVVNRIRGGKAVGIGQGLKSPIRSLENFASITEKSTRFQNYVGAYKKAIASGLDHTQASEKAAMQAWQNSVDFSRAGTWGRVINSVIPYWNPATQGVRQMGRTFTKHPVKSGAAAVALVGVPIATATAWNLSSPENAEIYANIPEYEKNNNLILIPPGTKQNQDGSYDVIKVPLPPGYKDAFMPIRRALEAFHNDKPLDAGKIAQDIIQTVSGPVSTQTKGAFVGSFIPQAAKPSVQWATNKDLFTGKQTVPDYVNNATDAQGNPIPENKKAQPYTSGTARIIGNLTGSSPIKVEKAIKDVAGSVGLNVLNAVDQGLARAGKIPEEQIGGMSVAEGFKRSFGQSQGIENANKTAGAKFYDKQNAFVKTLTPQEQSLFNKVSPARKNFLGEQIFESNKLTKVSDYADMIANPAFTKKFQDFQKSIDNHDPLWDLDSNQLRSYMQAQVISKNNPGGDSKTVRELYARLPQDFFSKREKYFADLKAKAQAAGRPWDDGDYKPRPKMDDNMAAWSDWYNTLPYGTGARSAALRSPEGQAYIAWLDQNRMYNNQERADLGLPPLEDPSSRYGSSGTGGGSGSARSYAISLKARGGSVKPNVTITKGGSPRKVVAKASKPKVSIKKSLV